MSAAQMRAAVLERYRGDQGFSCAKRETYSTRIQEEALDQTSTRDYLKSEIQGLRVAGIAAIVGVIVTLAFGYGLLASLFAVPLAGIALGAIYIRRMKQDGQ